MFRLSLTPPLRYAFSGRSASLRDSPFDSFALLSPSGQALRRKEGLFQDFLSRP